VGAAHCTAPSPARRNFCVNNLHFFAPLFALNISFFKFQALKENKNRDQLLYVVIIDPHKQQYIDF
jgi:hypothetical protein